MGMLMKMRINNRFKKALNKFDLITYLESLDIDYKEKGKNVAQNNVGINCPYCDDTGFHMNIHLVSKIYACWRCPDVKGSFIELVRILEGLPRPFASKRVNKLLELDRGIELPDNYDLSEEISKRLNEDEQVVRTNKQKEVVTASTNNFNLPKPLKPLNELNKDFRTHKAFINYIENRGDLFGRRSV